jgi:hypothetical protein
MRLSSSVSDHRRSVRRRSDSLVNEALGLREVPEDGDPSTPSSPEIVYAERVCPVCGEPLSDKQTYDKDACRKQGSSTAALGLEPPLARWRVCDGR